MNFMDRIDMMIERLITLNEDHPSLAGHFPGHPVIPGVLLLGEVMKVIRQTTRRSIEFVGMPSAKFLSPLNPGETLTIRLDQEREGTTEFKCTTGSRVIASGCLRYRLVTDNSAGGS
jgi:3-hydroxymyristoyl/3-hydroxydecanoyl-(acyl carrier protein) dehydratase